MSYQLTHSPRPATRERSTKRAEFTATLRGGLPYRIAPMQQTFTVETVQDQVQEVVEVTIRCSPNLIQMGLDVARMQVEQVTRDSNPQPPPQLEGQHSPELDGFIDAQWKERSTGPTLPNMRGF